MKVSTFNSTMMCVYGRIILEAEALFMMVCWSHSGATTPWCITKMTAVGLDQAKTGFLLGLVGHYTILYTNAWLMWACRLLCHFTVVRSNR